LLNLIRPVSGKRLSHINNSFEFIDSIKQIELEERDQLVSFDVVSLFTSVPRQEAVIELRKRLERDTKLLDRTTLGVDKIMELIDLCLDSTYFQLGDKFLEQRRGLAMGSPLSPVLADLYMEKIDGTISSLLAYYAIKQDHQVLWDDVKIFGKRTKYKETLVS
jgi:hypothetical protein